MEDATTSSAPSAGSSLRFEPTAELRPLREEVLELIEPWRGSSAPSPFTTGELIVIVLVISDKPYQTLEQIEESIFRIFGGYGKGVRHRCSKRIFWNTCLDDPQEMDPLALELISTFKEFDYPNCIGKIDDYDVYEPTEVVEVDWRAALDARLYLRNWLEPPRQGVFKFLELPAELREKIYKMLMLYPKPWLAFEEDDDFGKPRLGVASVTDVADSDYKHWGVAGNNIAIESLTKTLAILRVSKQIRHEALPVFYAGNTFKFEYLDFLLRALSGMSPETCQQIKHLRVHVNVRCEQGMSMHKLNEFLAYLAPKKLVLVCSRGSSFWEACCGGYENRTATLAEMRKVDGLGLDGLASLAKRAEQVELQDNGFLRAWFEGKI